VVDDEETNPTQSYLVRTLSLQVSDGKLTLEMGIFDEYTMLNYLDIEAVVPAEIAGVRIGGDGHVWLDLEHVRPGGTPRSMGASAFTRSNATEECQETRRAGSWGAAIRIGACFVPLNRGWRGWACSHHPRISA
jgi:hypothetical protein